MIEIRHIGVIYPICGANGENMNGVRSDLSHKEYIGYQRHPFIGEKKFRFCKRCLAAVRKREKALK